LTVIVINNKEQHASFSARIHTGGSGCTQARVLALDGSKPAIHPLPDLAWAGDQVFAKLPPMSAILFVCDGR
jgi:hypothetical protein